MMRRILTGLTMLLSGAMSVAAQGTTVAVTGYLTDTMCGAKGTNARHADHARRSVASGKARYALYVQTQAPTARGASISGEMYILDGGQGSEAAGVTSAQANQNLAQLMTQYAGQRIRITGTLGETPIRRAGQSYAPDAVASVRVNGEQRPVSGNASRTGTGTGSGAADPNPRVQSHQKALDESSRVAGVLMIYSVELSPR